MGEARDDTGKIMERAGLTANEVKVYLALLRLGEARAGRISKNAEINRSSTYDSLKRLLDKGLVSYVIAANRKHFRPVKPERLIGYLKEQEEDVRRILPQLNVIFHRPSKKHYVRLYHGYKGVKTVFQDIIDEAKINRVLDSEGYFSEKMPYYAPHFVRQIEKKGIHIRHIVRKGRAVRASTTTKVKYMAKKTKSDACFNLYADKIAIIIWTDPPEAVVIENKSAADSFKEYFDMIWNFTP